MSRVYTTPESIASSISICSCRILVIDGFLASGKTTLAKALAKLLGLRLVRVDNYLGGSQGPFVANLRLNDLAADLRESSPCIFEGVCALEVLRLVDLRPDILIYVKPIMSFDGADKSTFEFESPRSEGGGEGGDKVHEVFHSLYAEVDDYHHRYRPDKVADLLYAASPSN